METLFKKSAVVSGLTLFSRILGVVRDALIAMIFGGTAQSDAFFIAFRPFDLMRKTFSEGVMTISFIPEFSRYLGSGQKDQALAMVGSALVLLSAVAVLVVAAGLLFTPLAAGFIAPGFAPDSPKFNLTVVLLNIMLPYVWVIMVIALCMGVLNSFGNFTVPAVTPVLFNLVVILFTLLATGLFDIPVMGLGMGVMIGGLVQLCFQVPFMKRTGILTGMLTGVLTPVRTWRIHPGVVRTMKRLVPCMVGAASFQINILLASLFASYLADGSVSYLYYADRLVQFPLALIGASVSTVLLPTFSREAAIGRMDAISDNFDASVRLVMFVTIPAMAGLAALDDPIVGLLFGQGAFGPAAVAATADCLFYLVFGLWAVTATRLLTTLHYGISSILDPFYSGVLAIGVNIFGCLLLMPAMGIRGLAVSVSLAACAAFLYLFFRLPSGVVIQRSGMVVSACRALFVSVIMFFLVSWTATYLIPVNGGKMLTGIGIAACVCLGIAFIFAAAKLLRFPEVDLIRHLLEKEESHGGG